MRFPKPLVVFDIETTGVDPDIYDICQIGAVFVNRDGCATSSFSSYVKPLGKKRDEKAMRIHNISEATLSKARGAGAVLFNFENWITQQPQTAGAVNDYALKNVMLATWGNGFDTVFLEATYKKLELEYPFSRKTLDLKSVCMYILSMIDKPISSGLLRFSEILGLPDYRAHDALEDARRTYTITRILTNVITEQEFCLKRG